MKRIRRTVFGIAMALCVFVFLGFVTLNFINRNDVPEVFIRTSGGIRHDAYVKCSVRVVDGKAGHYATVFDDNSKVKIRGNSTSGGAKKPYNIKFSSKTDVLGMGKNKKWCLLANCFDPTLLRNLMAFDFADQSGVPYTPDYRVVDVYVNTDFLGSYLLTDAVEASPTRVDIDLSDNEFLLELDYGAEDEDSQYFYSPIYNVKFAINEPEKSELTEEQLAYLTALIQNAEEALQNGDYDKICEYIDLDSFINFYITLELFKDVDVKVNSTRFHIKDGKIYGGPAWDFDLSTGNCEFNYYAAYNNADSSGNSWEGLWATRLPWFGQLLNMETSKQAIYSRYLELQDVIVNLYDDNINGVNRIDYYAKKYKKSFERNYGEAGWGVDQVYSMLEREPDSTYEANVEYLREWLRKRNEWLLNEWNLNSSVSSENK